MQTKKSSRLPHSCAFSGYEVFISTSIAGNTLLIHRGCCGGMSLSKWNIPLTVDRRYYDEPSISVSTMIDIHLDVLPCHVTKVKGFESKLEQTLAKREPLQDGRFARSRINIGIGFSVITTSIVWIIIWDGGTRLNWRVMLKTSWSESKWARTISTRWMIKSIATQYVVSSHAVLFVTQL